MRMETNKTLAILVAFALAGAPLAEAGTRARSGGKGAAVTRPSGGSASARGGSGSTATRGTAIRPPSRGSTGSASVTRRGRSGSPARPGTPIYRPPRPEHRPPGYRPPGYPYYPHWGWRAWSWPYSHWHWSAYWWGPWRPYYWGAWGFWGAWGDVYPSPTTPVEVYRVSSEVPRRGGFDLKVRPGTAEVWIDGRYAGLAKEFDGYPSYLWLGPGDHRISFYLPGYRTESRGVEVVPGSIGELKLKLRRGESEPPPGR